ncbi:MAG: ATPase, T2SS/T4P/T4SS family [Lachnospiraceae bacterium]
MQHFWSRQEKLRKESVSLQTRREEKERYSYRAICETVKRMLNEYAGENGAETGLPLRLLKSQEEQRRMFSECIRTCCSGNEGSRAVVKELIRTCLTKELELNETNILYAVPFYEPERMSARELMETMIYLLDKKTAEEGFRLLCEAYGWCLPKKTEKETSFFVTEQEVRRTWERMMPELTYEDCLNILVRLLFADTVGLGVIDTLNWQKGWIEEIQIGMNGLTAQAYHYRTELKENKEGYRYSKDSVHVLVQGCTVWLKYLSFGSEEELQRVLRNLMKDSGAGELTINHPMTVVDTPDGRRVTVARPPMTDGWVGLVRKFDTIRETTLESLYVGQPQGKLAAGLLRQLVRSGKNIAITGEMASGKTTLFRACLAETRKELNIRIIEADSFELNVRQFLPMNNSLAMRVTAYTPAAEVLAFARKTTGHVFGIGEVNSPALANMAMDLSKIATQLFFSAHYLSTEDMISDFTNARLCIGGYTEEVLAEQEAVRTLGFDVHLWTREGKRYIQYIHEVVPEARGYHIHRILEYEEERGEYCFLSKPTKRCFQKARQTLSGEQYKEFEDFFRRLEEDGMV